MVYENALQFWALNVFLLLRETTGEDEDAGVA